MPIQIEGFAGGDRTLIELPKAQQDLLEALSATGKPLVVVLMGGSAIAVPWANQHANAILEAWYPGEQGGTAIADTLAGLNNPAGRLPVTVYAATSQLPAFDDYAMHNRTYRYFQGQPLYPFGYGLSYSKFTYSNLKLSTTHLTAGSPLEATVTVKNTSTREGDEVAELYLMPPQSEDTPKLQLDGFQRLHLKAGEQRQITFKLDPRQLSLVDTKGTRAVQPGDYTLAISGAQPIESTPTAKFTITGTHPLPK